jgi:hypothetical protein
LFLLDPDATSDLSDAVEELDDLNIPADDESIIPPSQTSSYRKKKKGSALYVSQRDDFLYISRLDISSFFMVEQQVVAKVCPQSLL